MQISIIGDGGWGTALGLLLHGYGHRVTMWGHDAGYLEQVRGLRRNPRFLPGVELPAEMQWTADAAAAAAAAEAIVLAMPSSFYLSVLSRFVGLIGPDLPVISVTKGLCEKSHRRMSELASDVLRTRNVAVLSGPSHAEEVSRQIPTAVVAASADDELARFVQRLFNGPRFRVYTSSDVLGVEMGAAVKNVIAIAVGASDGLGFGDNTRAALITRGLAEMTRLGVAMGGQAETFSGLSGVGDLVVTCTSRHSRNHTVGERLGRGERIADILGSMMMVAEGVWNARVVDALAGEKGIEMPICRQVHRLCDGTGSALEAVELLMGREARPESNAGR